MFQFLSQIGALPQPAAATSRTDPFTTRWARLVAPREAARARRRRPRCRREPARIRAAHSAPPLEHGVAAVEHEGAAGDVVRLARGEEDGERPRVALGVAEALDRPGA